MYNKYIRRLSFGEVNSLRKYFNMNNQRRRFRPRPQKPALEENNNGASMEIFTFSKMVERVILSEMVQQIMFLVLKKQFKNINKWQRML